MRPINQTCPMTNVGVEAAIANAAVEAIFGIDTAVVVDLCV